MHAPSNSMAVQQIPFHGQMIEAHRSDDDLWVVFRPIVEQLGIDYSGQLRRLRNSSWASCGRISTTGADGKTYEMVTVNRRTLTMWLATIHQNKINEQARPLLALYQSESADVLDAYWHKGGAINPRADEHQVNALIFQSRAQLEMIQAAKGLIHSDHLEAKARVVLARGLGEHAELDPLTRPLYTQDFLKSKNLSRRKMSSTAGVFGKRVKKAYTERHGRSPHQYPLDMSNGQTRNVNAYTEADRDLMEQVWDQHYAVGTQGVLA